MPRKKEKFVSLEVIETNSTWDDRPTRVLSNCICKADDAEKLVQENDRREFWKHEESYTAQVKAILAPAGTRNASTVFFNDDVNVEEVKLPASAKGNPKYIYKIYDYNGDKCSTEYGVQKDILAYISKKVKTKYAYVTYNGQSSRIENNPKTIVGILNELEKTTSQFEIEPIGRSGTTDNSIFVTMFKNYIK